MAAVKVLLKIKIFTLLEDCSSFLFLTMKTLSLKMVVLDFPMNSLSLFPKQKARQKDLFFLNPHSNPMK